MLSTPGVADLRAAARADFDGPGDAWSPEHLLLAAVQTCFLLTLRSIARASHVDFISLHMDTAGTVDRQEGLTRFTEIVLRPRLVVARGASATDARLPRPRIHIQRRATIRRRCAQNTSTSKGFATDG